MKRKIAAIGMTILMTLGVSGCMESYEEKNEAMLLHMQEKYGVEFEIQYYIPRNVDCSYDVWCCNAVGDDPELDKIEVHRYYGDMAKDGEYADEYYVRMTKDEIERRTIEAFSSISGVAKAYVNHLEFADEEYREIDQLDEFLQTEEGKRAYRMLVFIEDKEKEGILNKEVIDKITNILPDAGIGNVWCRICFIKDEEVYQQIERDTYRMMLKKSGEEQIYTDDFSGTAETGFD